MWLRDVDCSFAKFSVGKGEPNEKLTQVKEPGFLQIYFAYMILLQADERS
jgi:hypothetical protein